MIDVVCYCRSSVISSTISQYRLRSLGACVCWVASMGGGGGGRTDGGNEVTDFLRNNQVKNNLLHDQDVCGGREEET